MTTGIVHFGPGAFHRAHQADYIDRLLEDDPQWGIAAVSLRSADTVEALKRQEGLYTLAILEVETRFRTIHPHSRFLGPREGEAVRALLGDPAVRIVTSTVTEKGYCLASDGTLDLDHPDIRGDLDTPNAPTSLVGRLALGLSDRRAGGVAPFTAICCDNMASNGAKLRRAVIDFASRLDPSLADWIEGEARFPCTMVDSIVPATDDRLREMVRAATGLTDAVPVSREAYAAWVIEDMLPAGSPDLASVGAVLATDVGAWERAKLRILNGAHSTLSYLGLLIGHETVDEAMADPKLAGFVETLIRADIVPSLENSPLDLGAYVDEILQRFRNPAIRHRLAQIAWDGSQKLPYRLIDTIVDALAAKRSLERLAVPVAAWMLFIERQARARTQVVDPLAEQLETIACAGDLVGGLLALRQIFPERAATDPAFRAAVDYAARMMRENGPYACLDEDRMNG